MGAEALLLRRSSDAWVLVVEVIGVVGVGSGFELLEFGVYLSKTSAFLELLELGVYLRKTMANLICACLVT